MWYPGPHSNMHGRLHAWATSFRMILYKKVLLLMPGFVAHGFMSQARHGCLAVFYFPFIFLPLLQQSWHWHAKLVIHQERKKRGHRSQSGDPLPTLLHGPAREAPISFAKHHSKCTHAAAWKNANSLQTRKAREKRSARRDRLIAVGPGEQVAVR